MSDSVVVGAGAAGLSAALFAARAGARVRVLETKPRPGAKILISGGGRCNVLPSALAEGDFHSTGSTRTLRALISSWPLEEVRAFFEGDLGVPLKREPSGKLFPVSDRARDVLDALVAACERAGVRIQSDWELARLAPLDAQGFELISASGEHLRARRVVLATGGLSVPKTGSDGLGLRLARELGHAIAPTHPALVPLTASPGPWLELSGLAVPARLRARRGDRELDVCAGDFLFTHRGFSGPVVLDASRHLTAPRAADAPEVALSASFGLASRDDWDEVLRGGGTGRVGRLLREHLPRRLAELVLGLAEVDPDVRLAELGREARRRLATAAGDWRLPVTGDEGYKKAEVTAGGVELAEVHARTLESRRVAGLHFAGEILDVTGRIGGFNFLWAWASGRAAGEALAAAVRSDAPDS